MSNRKIVIKIDQMGTPTIEAVGFAGSGCEDATASLEAALGGTVDSNTLKPEYYTEGDEQQQQHQSW